MTLLQSLHTVTVSLQCRSLPLPEVPKVYLPVMNVLARSHVVVMS